MAKPSPLFILAVLLLSGCTTPEREAAPATAPEPSPPPPPTTVAPTLPTALFTAVPSHGSALIQAATNDSRPWLVEFRRPDAAPIQITPKAGQAFIGFLAGNRTYEARVVDAANGSERAALRFTTLSDPHAWAGEGARIHPGARLQVGNHWCTLGFIFRDATNDTLYAATAGHCIELDREDVRLWDGTLIGHSVHHAWNVSADAYEDYAIIRLDADMRGIVDPGLPILGGPTRHDDGGVSQKDDVCLYGWGRAFQDGEQLRCGRFGYRSGALLPNADGDDHFIMEAIVDLGDSGAPVLTPQGHPVGVTIGGPPGQVLGLSICGLLERARTIGLELQVATADLKAAARPATLLPDLPSLFDRAGSC